MAAARSGTLEDLLEKMQFNHDEIKSCEILQAWLEKHSFVLSSSIAAAENTFENETRTTSVDCTSTGITFSVRNCDRKALKVALQTAAVARDKWVALSTTEKVQAIYKLAQSFEQSSELFATAEAACYTWKPFERCRATSVQFAIEYLYSTAAKKYCYAETTDFQSVLIIQEASNTPERNLIADWRLGEALANDCSLVLVVPAAYCLPALVFSEICTAANLPKGLFTVLIMNSEEMSNIQATLFQPSVSLLRLSSDGVHLSRSIILAEADLHSAVNGAIEMLADRWGTSGYIGVMLYIQDCVESKTTRILRDAVKRIRIHVNNFAKTLDIVSKSPVRVVRCTQIPLDETSKQPTIYYQGFKNIEEVSKLISTGPLRSDSLSIWTEHLGVASEISELSFGYRNIWVNGEHYFHPSAYSSDWLIRCNELFALYDPSCRERNIEDSSAKLDRPELCETGISVYASGDMTKTVESAAKAFPGWYKLAPVERLKYMLRFVNVVSEFEQQRSKTKPVADTAEERLQTSACDEGLGSYVRVAFEGLGSCGGETMTTTSSVRTKVFSSYRPHGVIGILCSSMTDVVESFISLVAGAIANGNTVVVLIPGHHSFLASTLCQLAKQCAFPTGVINVLTGPTEEMLVLLAGHRRLSALWCPLRWKIASVVAAFNIEGKKRPVWWFNDSIDRSSSSLERQVQFHRGYMMNVWMEFRR